MNPRGRVGLAALRKLVENERSIARCDERMLEKLLRRVLNDVEEFSMALTGGNAGAWYPGAVGRLPDLMAEDQDGQFLAGLEVKTRARINWGWYGTETWQSQLDRYTSRVDEIHGEEAPLYLIATERNIAKVNSELAATGEYRITSAQRWTVLSLRDLLKRAPESGSARDDQGDTPAVDLLTRLLSEG